jgi:predicted esterase
MRNLPRALTRNRFSLTHALAVALALARPLSVPSAAVAQEVAAGVVVERIVSPSDTTQTYATYLPSAYDPARRWPILFLLDPRGRALVPLELFRDAAETNGWILMSSYNSVSDGPAEPNALAMNAMLADSRASFSLADDRLYIGGFSGTARLAWEFAGQLEGRVAGIFGASASLTPRAISLPLPPARVPFYGTTGALDFNHDEVVRFAKRLETWALPHRIRVFDGGHQWPPAPLATEALDWFDLHAMRTNKIPTETGFIARMYARDSTAIVALRNLQQTATALSRAREIVADYDGLRDTGKAAELARVLSADRNTRAQIARAEQLLDDGAERQRRLYGYLDRVRAMARLPRVNDAVREFDIRGLQRQAENSDSARALAAGRALEEIFVAVSFYTPREFMERNDPERALVMLEVAELIHAAHPQVLFNRARALAVLGRTEEARATIDAALRAGVRPETVRADSLLSGLMRK